MSDLSDPNSYLTRLSRWRDVTICLLGLALICFATVTLLAKAQPVVSAITLVGLLLLPWVVLKPMWGLLLFLWLAHTIDGIKRMVYAVTTFSQTDIAGILIVPVLVMGGLYLKLFFLKWFGDRTSPPISPFKFWPILITLIGGVAFTLRGGLSFEQLVSNYTSVCYIPAGIAVPYILYSTERRLRYVKTLVTIGIILGIYGLLQVVHGPFAYESTYLFSGLTMTRGAIEGQTYFRAFSMLNFGPTFCGCMVMITLLSYFYFCRGHARLKFNRGAVFMTLFTLAICFAVTQRGAAISFLLTLLLLPLFTRPRALVIALVVGLAGFVGVIYFATELLDWLYVANDVLANSTDNVFLQQNASILTYAQRLNGFSAITNPALWTPFGTTNRIGESNIMANDIAGGHDLISNFLEWFGYVGTGTFLLIVTSFLLLVIKRTRLLLKTPKRALWAQCNLGVFLFMMIWQLLTGPAMHVSPLQFYLWVAIGNLNYLLTEQDRDVEDVAKVGQVTLPSRFTPLPGARPRPALS